MRLHKCFVITRFSVIEYELTGHALSKVDFCRKASALDTGSETNTQMG
jgi:hypothetical protein